MRRPYILLLAVLFALVFLNTAYADIKDQVRMKVAAGFEKEARVGSWAPVTVFLENTGNKDIQGRVILQYDQRRQVRYWRPVVLAAGAKKRLDFFIPLQQGVPISAAGYYNKFLTAVFQSGNEEIVQEVALYITSPNNLYVAVVAAQPGTLNHLSGVDLSQPGKIGVVHLPLAALPAYGQVLANFSVIVFNNIDTGQLTAGQLAALKHWLAEGGTLIIGGGPNWQQTLSGLPGELLPVAVTGLAMLDELPALAKFGGEKLAVNQPVPAAKGRLAEGGQVMVIQGDIPLIAKKEVGRGTVIFSAMDLGLEPLVSWNGNNRFWAKILSNEVMSARSVKGRPIPARPADFRALQQLSALELPGVSQVLVVIIVYLLLIGVINYRVLKRFDRRDWAWVTVPLLVALFTSGIYLMGSRGRGDVISNNISLVTLEGNNRAWGRFYTGVFAPSRADYEISIPRHVLPVAENFNYYGPDDAGPTDVSWRQGETRVAFERMPIWSMRSVMYEEPVEVTGGIESRLVVESGKIKGTVTNNTRYNLKEAIVFTAQADVVELGDLSPGQTVEVTVSPSPFSGRQGPALAYELANRIWGMRSGMSDPEREQRRAILEGMFGYEGYIQPGAVNFLAWNDRPLRAVNINGEKPEERKDLNVFYTPLSLDKTSKDYSLPPGLVTGEIYRTEGNKIDISPGEEGEGVHFAGGAVYYRLELPPGVAAHAESAVIYLQGEPELVGNTSVYNVDKEEWETLRVSGNKAKLAPAASYIANGQVKIKVTNPSNRHEFFRGVTISVDGGEK